MKSGTVAVVGRSNAGKSTLVNVLVGEKISITSPKPQTTRDRIYGVLTTDDYQIVFEDTPGLYKAKNALNSRMQREAVSTAKDCDVILFVVDGHAGVSEEDVATAKKYCSLGVPTIIAVSKTDITDKNRMPENLIALSETGASEIVPVSARKGKNVKELLTTLLKYTSDGEYVFDPNAVSDKSEKFMVGELMREKILLKYEKEIPHGAAIVVNTFEKRENGVYEVNLDVVCEKKNHKAILIGKQGQALKEVASFARKDMEKFLGAKVFLTVYVKVKEDWRDREGLIREFGYGTEE